MASDPREWLTEVQETVDTERVLRDGDPFYEVQGYLPDGTPLMECNRWERVGLDVSTAMSAALTAVLGLHYPLNGPHEHLVCAHRHCIDDAGDQCRWPCMTARAVTENLPKEDDRG